jgi:EAL domain-containing protein (putative c-di-GMP-specific phosphodiesterase class I)
MVMASTGIAPELVAIELTETVLADGHGEVAALRALRELGCRIALDDFGTGFSSLSGLRDLPIDVVKLDRSFITPLPEDRQGAAMVEAVIRLAEALDLMVVAEGVETEAQALELRALGCPRLQGYLISRPVPPDELVRFLTASQAEAPRTGQTAAD